MPLAEGIAKRGKAALHWPDLARLASAALPLFRHTELHEHLLVKEGTIILQDKA